jgi:S-adenosylmethionine synthetase
MIDTHGNNQFKNGELKNLIRELFNLTPEGIIGELELLKPIYRQTATYGHFGREDIGFSWEKTDRVDEIKSYLSVKK